MSFFASIYEALPWWLWAILAALALALLARFRFIVSVAVTALLLAGMSSVDEPDWWIAFAAGGFVFLALGWVNSIFSDGPAIGPASSGYDYGADVSRGNAEWNRRERENRFR